MKLDRKRAIEAAALALAPKVPARDLAGIVAHAVASRGLRTASPEAAAWLSLVSYIRHNLTDYDAMLEEGYGAEAARHFCRDALNDVLERWGARLRAGGDDED